jgi:teichuronic acid biosynthesis glycosyltransferase TuaG
MNNLNDLVTVISPAYNSEKYILRLVECVQNQSLKALEHIIIDDGSSDNTFLILHELASKYQNIIVISQKNKGAGAARNEGIKIAKGKYIAFLDSDDFWENTKLEFQISFMEANVFSFSYGAYSVVDDLTYLFAR